jgi:hypothetical protein
MEFTRRGESRTTKYRKRKANEIIKNSSSSSHKVTEYFSRIEDEDINDETSDVELDFLDERKDEESVKESPQNIMAILETLDQNNKSALPTNVRDEKKNMDVSKHQFLKYLCVKSYFNKRLLGLGKMAATNEVAQTVFHKSPAIKKSYKALSIRQWANHFLQHKELKSSRQGKHTKTFTIITDEAVKDQLKIKIRALKSEQRYPAKKMHCGLEI